MAELTTSQLTIEAFEKACEVVKQVTLNTDLVQSDYYSEQTGGKVYPFSFASFRACSQASSYTSP